jgi:hypothetical protein
MSKAIFEIEHIEFINERLNRAPKKQLIADFVNKYPCYSSIQISAKIERMLGRGRPSAPYIGFWSAATLAKTLGISHARVDSWRHRGLQTNVNHSVDKHHTRYYISRQQFEAFAIAKPQILRGIKASNIRKITKSKKVFAAIEAYLEKPHPSDIVIIRLNDGQVFQSAVQAAKFVNSVVTDKGILYNCASDKPMVNGMDWYKLSYPCFEVPLSIKKEFLYWSGLVFYEMYQELVTIEGYKKSCLVVAVRNAVQVALFTFRRQARQIQDNQEVTPKSELVEFYQKGIIDRIKKLYNKTERDCWQSVKNGIEKAIANIVTKKTNEKSVNLILEEIALIIMERRHKHFYKNFLPIGYNPQSRLEKADYFQYIYASAVYAVVDFKSGKRVRTCIIEALAYLERIYNKRKASSYIDEMKAPDTEQSISSELESILTQVGELDIGDELKQKCRRQVDAFIDSNGASSIDKEVMEILRRASAPF